LGIVFYNLNKGAVKKFIAILCLVACFATGSFAQSSIRPYDTTQFAWWASASNDSGQTCVAFVTKKDTAGDSIYPIYYQKYQGIVLVKNDTLVKKWKRITPFGASEFFIVLDRHGAAHFVFCGDSLFCYYLSDRLDGQWKQRAYAAYATGACGRANGIALYGDQLDIIWTLDYRVGGGYPFSNLHRFSTTISSDSVANLYVNDSLHNINDEFVYDIQVSNQCGRLIILQANRQYGGYASDKIIMSKGFPAVIDYYCLVLRQGWAVQVAPIAIVKDEPTLITVSISGLIYKVAVGDSGFSGTTGTIARAVNSATLVLYPPSQKVFNLSGCSIRGMINSPGAAGIYFLKPAEAAQPIKRLQVRR
jgi:hypothetical protein